MAKKRTVCLGYNKRLQRARANVLSDSGLSIEKRSSFLDDFEAFRLDNKIRIVSHGNHGTHLANWARRKVSEVSA